MKKWINWQILFWPPIEKDATAQVPVVETYYRADNVADAARWAADNFAALAKGAEVAEISVRDPDNKFAASF